MSVESPQSPSGSSQRSLSFSLPESPPESPKKKKLKLDIANNGGDDGFKVDICKIFKNIVSFKSTIFTTSGELREAPLVLISLENHGGILRFPLGKDEIGHIIANFNHAPYGLRPDVSAKNFSWELSSKFFRIINPLWNEFVDTKLMARIKEEMLSEKTFFASLCNLSLYTPGTSYFFKDYEKENALMPLSITKKFGTLFVQLPSKFSGGQTLIKHDGGISKTIDTSSINNREFCTFYSVFIRGCETEILPVTKGVRVCLIYNLIEKKEKDDGEKKLLSQTPSSLPPPSPPPSSPPPSTSFSLPTTPLSSFSPPPPSLPVLSFGDAELAKLFQSWKNEPENKPALLVWALSNEYNNATVSFANLTTKDKAIANVLKHLATEFDLVIHLGLLKKKSGLPMLGKDSEESYATTDDDDEMTSYRVTRLTPLDSSFSTPNLFEMKRGIRIDFKNEVIPTDCFDEREPFKQQHWLSTNSFRDEEIYFYHATALVIWPADNIIRVLTDGRAEARIIDQIFLEECEKKEIMKNSPKLLKWANVIANDYERKAIYNPDYFSCRSIYLVSNRTRLNTCKNAALLFNAMSEFNDLGLLKIFLENHRENISLDIIPSLTRQCQKYGWKSFLSELEWLFDGQNRLTDDFIFLRLLVKNDNNDDTFTPEKEFVCQALVKILIRRMAKSYPYFFLQEDGSDDNDDDRAVTEEADTDDDMKKEKEFPKDNDDDKIKEENEEKKQEEEIDETKEEIRDRKQLLFEFSKLSRKLNYNNKVLIKMLNFE